MQGSNGKSKPKDHNNLYVFLVLSAIIFIVCGITASVSDGGAKNTKIDGKFIAKEIDGGQIKKVVEDQDKITKADNVIKIGRNVVDRQATKINQSKKTTKAVPKVTVAVTKATKKTMMKSASKSVSSSGSIEKPIVTEEIDIIEKEKAFIAGQYIEENLDLNGKVSVTSTDLGETINITIYSQSYDSDTGMNKFNLTATKNGKSLLIHNPVRIYGMPLTIQQEQTVTKMVQPNINFLSPKISFANGSKVPDYELFNTLTTKEISDTIITEVEAPTEAVYSNLARALSTVEYGEPTFDGGDPTAIFYANGTWTVPAGYYSAKVTLVSGGGGGSGGYGGGVSVYTCDAVCTCTIHHTNQVYGQGAGGFGAANKTVNDIWVTPGSSYPVVIGGGGQGGNGTLWAENYYPSPCSGTADTVEQISGAKGTASTAFSNSSEGGLPGRVLGYYTKWNQTIHYIEYNHTAAGGAGYPNASIMGETGHAGYRGSGASGGSGYGAGGGGGGPEQYGYTPSGWGGRGASGLAYIEYSLPTIPVVAMSTNVTDGIVPTAIKFTDMSAGVPTYWAWDFGDNTSISHLKDPEHLYTVGRSYVVTLTAGNGAGNATKSFGYFNISDTPVANFSANKKTGPYPLLVTFTENSTGVPTAWFWNFDDGGYSLSGARTIYHTFNSSGTFNVSLSISNDIGSNVSPNLTITVFDPSSAAWDKPVYSPGDTGAFSYDVDPSYWDPAQYTYSVLVYDQGTSPTLKYSKSVYTQNGTESVVFDTTNYPIGYYFGYIARTKIEYGAATVPLGDATAHVAGIVTLTGNIQNAENGTLIDANVSLSQGTVKLNQFGIAGWYNTTGTLFVTSTPILFNVTAPGYRQYTMTMTPDTAKTYLVNITMIPIDMDMGGGSASIGGRVLDDATKTPIVGATVYAVNTTYAEAFTNVTNSWGYYRFDNMMIGRWYDVYSMKSGFKTSDHKMVQAV